MRFNLTNLFFGLAIFVTFSACQDHRLASPSGQRFRLKRLTSNGLRSYSSTVYNYNGQGQLVNFVEHSGSSSLAENGLAYTSTLTYDGQGRVVQILGVISPTSTQRFDYTYDTNGNISSIKRYEDSANPGTYVLTNTFTAEYSTGKFPTKITNTYATNPNSPEIEQYTYSNGNIIKVESNVNPTVNYSATTSPNPYYGMLTGFPHSSDYSINLMEILGVTYVDTYDSNGFISQQVQKASPVDNIYNFEYEAY